MRLTAMLLCMLAVVIAGLYVYSYDPGVAEGPFRKRVTVVKR